MVVGWRGLAILNDSLRYSLVPPEKVSTPRGSCAHTKSNDLRSVECEAAMPSMVSTEMERDAMVAHGASSFLKERMLDVSDNFRVFVCRKCGILCTTNPDKGIYRCNNCKNSADITQVRIPYSMKLLVQELMTMSVAPRLIV